LNRFAPPSAAGTIERPKALPLLSAARQTAIDGKAGENPDITPVTIQTGEDVPETEREPRTAKVEERGVMSSAKQHGGRFATLRVREKNRAAKTLRPDLVIENVRHEARRDLP
jgi:hypothetical protein